MARPVSDWPFSTGKDNDGLIIGGDSAFELALSRHFRFIRPEPRMRLCLRCGFVDTGSVQCPRCGFSPETIGGFPSYAPELARENSGFRESYFDNLATLEAGNWWFESRNALIAWALGRYYGRAESFLEVGCGTGFVISHLAKQFPTLRCTGSEIFSAALPVARNRAPQAALIQMDACHIPYVEEFDVVGAFDVLEHIEDDRKALGELHRACRPGGGILLTVPQHRFLWSAVDEYACHFRRYSKAELVEKCRTTGFDVVMTTSFVSVLLPLMLLSRVRMKTSANDASEGLNVPIWLNAIFSSVMRMERALIRSGVRLPAGGSLLLVGTKT
jgi:ubiquinone/menaquinone biosynthesis C-methylase UbiE